MRFVDEDKVPLLAIWTALTPFLKMAPAAWFEDSFTLNR